MAWFAKGKRSKKDDMEVSSRPSLRSSARLSKKGQEESVESAEDPHDLVSRFIWTHEQHFDEALAELKRGRKCSCWMWYIFPTPPWIVNGQERGSWTNIRYSLRTDEQARAYLSMIHSGVNLRKNYFEASQAIVYHLEKGQSVRQIVGIADEPKLISSWEYFETITRNEADQGLHNVIARGLALIKDPPGKGGTAPKKKEAGASAWSRSSDDETGTGSTSPTPSSMSISAITSDALSDLSSNFSDEFTRNSSELSTVESNHGKTDESYLETKTLSEDNMASGEHVDDMSEMIADAADTNQSSHNKVLLYPVYCDEVDCFNNVPCPEHLTS